MGEGTEKGGRARIAANTPPVVAVVPSFLFYSFVLLCCYYVQSPFPWGNLWGGCGVRPPHVSYVIQFVDGHLFRSLFMVLRLGHVSPVAYAVRPLGRC